MNNKKYLFLIISCLVGFLIFTNFVLANDQSQLSSNDYPSLKCVLNEQDICESEVNINDKFSIILEGNPSTGYEWTLDYDKNYLSLDSEDAKSNCAPGMVGCSNNIVYNFSAIKSGKVVLTMLYQRSWENQSINKKVYSIEIKEVSSDNNQQDFFQSIFSEIFKSISNFLNNFFK